MSESNKRPDALLANFNPAEDALLEYLQPQLNNRLLGEIAKADYGNGARENFGYLKYLRDNLKFPAHDFYFWEVLELIRFSQPENPKWKPGLTGRDGHLMRAFCCAALVKAAGNPPETPHEDTAEELTLIHLVQSTIALGEEAMEAGLQEISWRALSLNEPYRADELRPFYALGTLLLAVSLYRQQKDTPLLKELAEWVTEEGDRLNRQQRKYNRASPYRWIVAVRPHMGEDDWYEATRRILLEPAKPHLKELDEILRTIGGMVIGS